MAFKTFDIPGLGTVTVYKRRGSRSLRLTVQPDGSLRVSIPSWAPYASGVTFARSRGEWIRSQQNAHNDYLTHGQQIGKAHRLVFVQDVDSDKVTARLSGSQILVRMPATISSEAASVQTAAKTASVRALRQQAEQLLPTRLRQLADRYGFSYKSVVIRQLKSRWGSCDQFTHITLSLYLMQLPWELIDYVLLHELTHTRVMQHGPKFWAAMETIAPNTKALRKAIRQHRPAL
jgi:predicted metal-dependent hydrolase